MEPELMNLTKEQKRAIEDLINTFWMKNVFSFMSYLVFAFVSNLIVVLLNEAYVHNQGMVAMMGLGTVLICIGNLVKTVEERRDILEKEVNKIIKN